MHIPLSDARAMAWWEYQALVSGHQPEDEEDEMEAPEASFVNDRMQRLRDMGLVH